jgi:hypothetical protein
MIYIVRADGCAGEFLKDIIFFVRASGRREKRDAVRAIGIPDPSELAGRMAESLIPGCFSKRFSVLHERALQSVGVLNEFVNVPTLDAEIPLICGTGFGWQGAYDLSVHHFEDKAASAGAIRA